MKTIEKNIQNVDYLALRDIMQWVEERVKEGWTVPTSDLAKLLPRRYGPGNYYLIMVDSNEPETVEEVNEEEKSTGQVESEDNTDQNETEESEEQEVDFGSMKKAELVEYADENGINIPEGVSKVAEIREFLKGEIYGNDQE